MVSLASVSTDPIFSIRTVKQDEDTCILAVSKDPNSIIYMRKENRDLNVALITIMQNSQLANFVYDNMSE